ncbi:E3 ubiquitin- ligase DZIP3 [Paramuricea clavata]|uniref:E3 ubiquitin- ligase DZIP3 n=1 Tax=Paramuricea clavata TaxID=317549 RepID=A0A7D9INS6_PARCT|nr:E3 ubiquitin- ligase DZIP3 [Paramuricea clavata]
MASPSQTLNDQANGGRLSRLLVNKGTQALRAAFDFMYPPPTLTAVLNTNKAILQKLRYKVINTSQWKLLYPSSGLPDSQNFDVTLLTVLLRNICGLTRPASGWDALPPDSDTSVAANIARIKFYRNQVHAHITTTEVADNEFENLWLKISKALIGLGIPKSELDELKDAPLSPEEADCIQLLEYWYKSEVEMNADLRETIAKFKNFQEELEQKSRESENVSVANKLGKCDFSGIRRSLNKTFLPGTRRWLLDQFSAWFKDKNSNSNVMILTAGPGVGKSVFAAEVCRMYDGKGQLAACHFCQYNKSDYSNPRMIIESLTSNMCDNVKGFKAKLDDQLQRSHSRETLSDAFRVLLNDPLHALRKREPMLFVIDALDESAVEGKSEFLELISEEFPKLPQWIKILITSRPELPVKEELQHLNPVQIIPRDNNNKDDLLGYLRKSLSHICNDFYVFWSLAEKCEGSFLYAYYTQLELKETTTQLTTENISQLIPKGISGFYQKQFKHLKNQLNDFGSSEVKLKRFLQILAAAKGPLPLSLLPECLGLPDDVEYEVRDSIIGIMSSILPVYDNCLTVYHKSLRDWLMSDGYEEHAFTVDSHSGHEYLWRVCKKEFDQIISLSTFSSFKPSPMTKYALAHGIFHMIESGSKTSYHSSVDVKIVHAKITNQIDRDQMAREWKEIVKNSPSSLSSELLQELDWHIELFQSSYFLIDIRKHPASYLQSVANRINCSNETRLLARLLLEHGHHVWFEDLDATNLTNHFYTSVSLRTDVTCMCVSSNEQLVAAGCRDGWISIFRVPDFQEVHTFDTMPESNACRSMHGGPLWSCSFSPSSVRLVTCDGSEKVKLWDVNSGNLLARLEAGGPVDRCSFSECGLFIAVYKDMKNYDQCDKLTLAKECIHECDEFTVWYALTLQRVDRRIIHPEEMDPCDCRLSLYYFPSGRNNENEFLLSCDGGCIYLFQSHQGLLVIRLARACLRNFPRDTIRYHWRFCVLYHTNELTKLTAFEDGQSVHYRYCICPCDSEATRLARLTPVRVQKLYVVPFVNKLDIFSVADQPSMSIQPSFVSEPYDISCCCFSPDGSFLATCANGDPLYVLIWDTNLCTVIQVVRFPLLRAEGCWWSESLLWIYDMDDVLVKIPISNGRTLDPSSARIEEIDWEPRKLLTFSDVLIFIDQENSVNVARIKNGELQYVETLPVDNPIICAAVSSCNSIILMVSWELTFHVWKEDQTSQPLHWVASNTGELLDMKDFSVVKGSELKIKQCKCCITSDNTKGVLVLNFYSRKIRTIRTGYFFRKRYLLPPPGPHLIFVDLNSLSSKITTMMSPDDDYRNDRFKRLIEIYAGNSYCVVADDRNNCHWLDAVNLATGEYVAKWRISDKLPYFDSPKFIVAHSRNDIVAIISKSPASVRFWKIVVPE